MNARREGMEEPPLTDLRQDRFCQRADEQGRDVSVPPQRLLIGDLAHR